ncbi:MAG: hypothetical protein QXI16_07455 [Sulfolobaceae archaeon]
MMSQYIKSLSVRLVSLLLVVFLSISSLIVSVKADSDPLFAFYYHEVYRNSSGQLVTRLIDINDPNDDYFHLTLFDKSIGLNGQVLNEDTTVIGSTGAVSIFSRSLVTMGDVQENIYDIVFLGSGVLGSLPTGWHLFSSQSYSAPVISGLNFAGSFRADLYFTRDTSLLGQTQYKNTFKYSNLESDGSFSQTPNSKGQLWVNSSAPVGPTETEIIESGFGNLTDSIDNQTNTIMGGLGSWFGNVFDMLGGVISAVWDSMTVVMSMVGDMINQVISVITGMFDSLFNFITDNIFGFNEENFNNGMESLIDNLTNSLGSVGQLISFPISILNALTTSTSQCSFSFGSLTMVGNVSMPMGLDLCSFGFLIDYIHTFANVSFGVLFFIELKSAYATLFGLQVGGGE